MKLVSSPDFKNSKILFWLNVELDEKKYYIDYFEKLRSDFKEESYLKRFKLNGRCN